MKKLTIITGNKCSGEVQVKVTENGEKTIYSIPVGVELTVSDSVAQAAIGQYDCLVGYYEQDETAVSALPVSGIADGSYCFCMKTGAVKFLNDGAWR